MFPDMYFQYNHPTNKSQQKPFDKNRQNLIPLHPPQRRFHTPPHNADSTLTPQRIQRSADAPPPPGKPQGNSAPAAIQRSADGSPTPVRPPRPHTPQKTERTDCQRGGCMVVPGAVVSPGHTRRLRRLSCRAPHNSPCTLMRTWLRQMGLTLRLVAAEYLPVRSPRRQV